MSHLFPPEESGIAVTDGPGQALIRHHGDPAAEYRAATEAVAVRDRSHRRQWAFTGRQPVEMLTGIVTGVMPGPPDRGELGVARGEATYHTVLTPKGKMIADLHLWQEPVPGGGDDEALVRAHVPAGAAEGLRDHLSRFLPPRLARLEDRSDEIGMICLAGPSAARMVSGVVLGLRVEGFNLLNRTNTVGFSYTQDPAYPDRRRPIQEVGFLPTFGFSVEF